MTDSLGENAPLPEVASAESTFREVNGNQLHVVSAGAPTDPIVLLLHGFPEFWYEWREYVDGLVADGYRVLVPDQRGYNRSEKPRGLRPYRLKTLSSDVVALLETERGKSAAVIGHDWGATVAWDTALRYPDVVDSIAVINMAHPIVFEQTLRGNPNQLRKSWYAFFFQIPQVPEWALRRNNFELIIRQMLETSRTNAFTKTDLERYKRAWSERNALRSMLNWYRAFVWYRDKPPRTSVEAPTQIIWGDNDHALVPDMADKSLEYCKFGLLERFPHGTHWVIHEFPNLVLDIILSHLNSSRSPR